MNNVNYAMANKFLIASNFCDKKIDLNKITLLISLADLEFKGTEKSIRNINNLRDNLDEIKLVLPFLIQIEMLDLNNNGLYKNVNTIHYLSNLPINSTEYLNLLEKINEQYNGTLFNNYLNESSNFYSMFLGGSFNDNY